MKHRYVWADTPLLRGAFTLPLFQCKASLLTMRQIGAHSIMQWQNGEEARNRKSCDGAVTLCYGAVSVTSSSCFPIMT